MIRILMKDGKEYETETISTNSIIINFHPVNKQGRIEKLVSVYIYEVYSFEAINLVATAG